MILYIFPNRNKSFLHYWHCTVPHTFRLRLYIYSSICHSFVRSSEAQNPNKPCHQQSSSKQQQSLFVRNHQSRLRWLLLPRWNSLILSFIVVERVCCHLLRRHSRVHPHSSTTMTTARRTAQIMIPAAVQTQDLHFNSTTNQCLQSQWQAQVNPTNCKPTNPSLPRVQPLWNPKRGRHMITIRRRRPME